jgi:hypothetical protein
MSEQRLKVQSGPPQHMIDEPADVSPPPLEEGTAGAQGAKEQVQQAAAPAKEKAQEVAGQAKEHAQAAADQAKRQAAAQVDERSTQVGQQLGGQGEALDGVAGALREQGKDGQAQVAEKAAEKVKQAGEYLEQADGEKLVETVANVARENPAAAAAVGAAAGFAAGRVIKASSPDDETPAADGPSEARP